MSNISLTHTGEAVQPVTSMTSASVEFFKAELREVRRQMGVPLYFHDRESLAEREARYAGYLKQAGVLS